MSIYSHDHATFIHVSKTWTSFCLMAHIGLANVSSSPLKKRGGEDLLQILKMMCTIKRGVFVPIKEFINHSSGSFIAIFH